MTNSKKFTMTLPEKEYLKLQEKAIQRSKLLGKKVTIQDLTAQGIKMVFNEHNSQNTIIDEIFKDVIKIKELTLISTPELHEEEIKDINNTAENRLRLIKDKVYKK